MSEPSAPIPTSSPRQSSPYDGPVRESTVRAGGITLKVVRPGDPDRLLDDPDVAAWNVADDYMPYWAYLWPGAFLLADEIARTDWPAGTRAIELGCGLGLSGLVAVAKGIPVEFTDHDFTPLRFVEASARANNFDPALYATSLVDWRTPPESRYALILGADVTYEHRLNPLVASAIDALLADGGVALITDPNRSAAEPFADEARKLGLMVETREAHADGDELGRVKGTIYRISRNHDQKK